MERLNDVAILVLLEGSAIGTVGAGRDVAANRVVAELRQRAEDVKHVIDAWPDCKLASVMFSSGICYAVFREQSQDGMVSEGWWSSPSEAWDSAAKTVPQ